MSLHRYCDGVRRRDFLKVGALGVSGLGLADLLRLEARGATQAHAPAKSAIMICLGGGPTHMDTFDMKPNAKAELRGEFNPIATNAPGVEISEHLPRLAKVADKFAILRGVSHTLAAHELGVQYMNTGNRPIPSLDFPTYGAVVSKELESQPDLPPWVAIPNAPGGPGYLGVAYSALSTSAVPKLGSTFAVRGISLSGGLTVPDVERRQNLLKDLDTAFEGFETNESLLSGMDEFSSRAHDMIRSSRAREAFDTGREDKKVAERFGQKPFGQSCLLAARLVEAGVRFVTVSFGGWDTHNDNFKRLKERLLPELDEGLSALFTTLDERGLLDSTAVLATGEFGRTPKINTRVGRDHWPRAMFSLMAGGGIRGGQVIGASDGDGMGPASEGISPDAIAASFYHALGIDHEKEYLTPGGRPVMVVRDGTPIPGLFS